MRFGTRLLLICIYTSIAISQSRAPVFSLPSSSSELECSLELSLSEAESSQDVLQLERTVSGSPLSGKARSELLSRLPPLPVRAPEPGPLTRSSTLPPPKHESVVVLPFPPETLNDDAPVPAATGPLRVTRYSPEGAVNSVKAVTISFSQDMVPLTSHAQLKPVPARIEPDMPGAWSWVSPRTLLFEHEQGLPMATLFSVSVPAQTRSLTGAQLSEDFEFQFQTPAVKLVDFWPNQDVALSDRPVFELAFNQPVVADAVLPFVHLRLGSQRLGLQLVQEVETTVFSRRNPKQHRLQVRPSSPLAADSTVTLVVRSGVPTQAGPLLSVKTQEMHFKTYTALKVLRNNAENRPLSLGSPLFIGFNNPLDGASFKRSMVKVRPSQPELRVELLGETMQIWGLTTGNATYEISLSPGISDIYGGSLGVEQTLEVSTGSAYPRFRLPYTFLVLDPGGSATLPVATTNYKALQVLAYAVSIQDWAAWQRFNRASHAGKQVTPPGRLVYERQHELQFKADSPVSTELDLGPILAEIPTSSSVILRVIPKGRVGKYGGRRERGSAVWLQQSGMGLDCIAGKQELTVWTNRLADGKPLAGVTVSFYDPQQPNGPKTVVKSDAAGLAVLPLPADNKARLILAVSDDDSCFMPESVSPYDRKSINWHKSEERPITRIFLTDDRGIYKPGEIVNIKGWVRRLSPTAPMVARYPAQKTIIYEAFDSRNNMIASGESRLSAHAGFDFAIKLPDNVNLGNAYVTVRIEGDQSPTGHGFKIREFRRPEFEVTIQGDTGPYLLGEEVQKSVQASYYAGGGLSGAEVAWSATTSKASFKPVGLDSYSFGHWTPWWVHPSMRQSKISGEFNGKTNHKGAHHLLLGFDFMSEPAPYAVNLRASVKDVNNQEWHANKHMLVHPSRYYVGLKSERSFVPAGVPFEIKVVVSDLEGQLQTDVPVEVRVTRKGWRFEAGKWQEEAHEIQESEVRSGLEPARIAFEPEQGGTYDIEARVRDKQGRENVTRLTRWVSGGQYASGPVSPDRLELIPNQQSYQVGETAEVLVRAPFSQAEGLMIIRQGDILVKQRFQMSESSFTLTIPISEEMLPRAQLWVEVVGSVQDSNSSNRPAYATGSLDLDVPPQQRELHCKLVLEPEELEPGAKSRLSVTVEDGTGAGVAGAEVTVMVVDEALLALTDYSLTNPLEVFYQANPQVEGDTHLRRYVRLAKQQPQVAEQGVAETQRISRGEMAQQERSPMAMEAGMPRRESMLTAKAQPAIALRENLMPLAAFYPALVSDRSGRLMLDLELPDNLTRYRVMVIAADEQRFGIGESQLSARLPLMLRPAAPRFLNQGDELQLPVVVQNQTDEELKVALAIRTMGLHLTGSLAVQVRVPARDRVRVLFPALAEQPGEAVFQVACQADGFTDGSQVGLPIWMASTREAFADHGSLEEGLLVRQLEAPTEVWPGLGGLKVTTSSTALTGLTRAAQYLNDYPYQGGEQLASRILANLALADMQAEGAIESQIPTDIDRLLKQQNVDGGFGYWRQGVTSSPFLSIHATHALVRAQETGYGIAPDQMAAALHYLERIDGALGHKLRLANQVTHLAYAVFVLHEAGGNYEQEAAKILARMALSEMPPEVLGWLLPVLDVDERKILQRFLENSVAETSATATFEFTGETGGQNTYYSRRRGDAIVLDSLMRVEPEHPLITKLVKGLQAGRHNERWGSTQETAQVLLALNRYYRTYEVEEPAFRTGMWLGDLKVGAADFHGRSLEEQRLNIPMKELQANRGTTLILSKEGLGRLYYGLTLTYVPKSLKQDAVAKGFYVKRRFEGVDAASDVRMAQDGSWSIREGARVRMVVTMTAPARRHHVALVAPLPAGLETLEQDRNQGHGEIGIRAGHWKPNWYDHQNLRDERAEAFAQRVKAGVYRYDIITRATTPGAYQVAPAQAEEMYHPETFGRSTSDRVVIR